MHSLQNSKDLVAGLARRFSGVERAGCKAVALFVAVGLAAPWTAASALPGDPVAFFVDETVTHDSNVFRVRDGGVGGTPKSSDTLATTTAGLTFDVPVSLQRFQGQASVYHTSYARFGELSHDGRDLRAAWLWQVGAPLSGRLGYADARRLSSFTTFTGARTPDMLTDRHVYGSAAWMMTPNWRLQAGLAERQYRHDASVRQADDVDVHGADAALSYVSSAENSIGIGWRQERGAFQNSASNDFRHESVGLTTDWIITGKSRLFARLEQARRDSARPGADRSCTLYRVAYDWQMTDKFALNAALQREFAPAEDIESSSALVEGLSLRPRFVLTEKMALSGNVGYGTRDYVGSVPSRTDHVRVLGATLAYRPMESLALSLLVQHEKRTSNIALQDYTANLVGLSARLAF